MEILVSVPAQEAKKYFTQAAENISKKKPIKGFRPGAAPLEVVKNTYGANAIFDEFLDIALKKTFEATLKEHQFPYVGSPRIDILKLAQGDDFEYKIIYPIFPDFSLELLNDLKISLPDKPEVSEKELNEAIGYLLNSRAKMSKVSRPANLGDYIDIDFSSKIGEVLLENGSARNYGFILGKGNFIKGFEAAIVNLKEGESVKFSLNAPQDYPHKQIAGKKVDFEVKLNAVFQREIPELTDEFAKSLGSFKSIAELKKSIAQGILLEKQNQQKKEVREKILAKLREIFKFPVSQILIEQEASSLAQEAKDYLSKSGLSWADYLKRINKEEKDIIEDFKQEAQKRLQNAIIIEKISKEKNLLPDENEILAKANEILKFYPSVQDAYNDFTPDQLKERARQNLIQEKVFEFLEKIVGYKN